MLLQTNSYVVPREKRTEHARLLQRFRQVLQRLGCDQFEVYEQAGVNWSGGENGDIRCVQIMRFRDRQHQLSIQAGEKTDPQAQALVRDFCNLINFDEQQQKRLFAVGYYNSLIASGPVPEDNGAPSEPANHDEHAPQSTTTSGH